MYAEYTCNARSRCLKIQCILNAAKPHALHDLTLNHTRASHILPTLEAARVLPRSTVNPSSTVRAVRKLSMQRVVHSIRTAAYRRINDLGKVLNGRTPGGQRVGRPARRRLVGIDTGRSLVERALAQQLVRVVGALGVARAFRRAGGRTSRKATAPKANDGCLRGDIEAERLAVAVSGTAAASIDAA